VSLVARVQDLLAPGGRLATRWPRYEERASQRELAGDVARAFDLGGVLLAEAPTGVGKSLAYLLPAVLLAAEGEKRVVVATCTRSLQDQLFERDLPALLEALELSVPCARLKGKANYLCPPALDAIDARDDAERAEIDAFRAWAGGDGPGDLDLYPARDAEAFRRLRPRLATDPVACSGPGCRRGRECPWVRARRRASEARILVVNHALLDGTKRLGWLATATFLHINGIAIIDAANDDVFDLVMHIAADNPPLDEIVGRLRALLPG